ncbi:hypothetical protein BURMUCGD2M_4374 [Burkholderia multivorans CGD2M]|uniref:Uncharacterized protein n=1 Tax=Burkholderia multivorans CGD2 TaxID=513052 RepID=B9BHD6_9BURK|nr:hypothetical protein BURMUCGD2_4385 [Burkholderia multivorans CGD2]EEE14932.1 hypothetical protein BURMUCGD2M_4374 [Burkholderia multivorans CGD2M]
MRYGATNRRHVTSLGSSGRHATAAFFSNFIADILKSQRKLPSGFPERCAATERDSGGTAEDGRRAVAARRPLSGTGKKES